MDSTTVLPSDPTPGQGYAAAVTSACLTLDSYATLSVVETDGYSDSVSSTVEGDAELTLSVLGVEEGIADLVTVKVNLMTLRQIAVVF